MPARPGSRACRRSRRRCVPVRRYRAGAPRRHSTRLARKLPPEVPERRSSSAAAAPIFALDSPVQIRRSGAVDPRPATRAPRDSVSSERPDPEPATLTTAKLLKTTDFRVKRRVARLAPQQRPRALEFPPITTAKPPMCPFQMEFRHPRGISAPAGLGEAHIAARRCGGADATRVTISTRSICPVRR